MEGLNSKNKILKVVDPLKEDRPIHPGESFGLEFNLNELEL